MGGLVYNEISKIVAQRRFFVVMALLTVIAILSALTMRGFAGALGVTAAQMVSTGASGGFAQLLFPLLIAVIVGDIVAGELTEGTLKLLLIRPVSRWKIWLSKLIAAFFVSVALVCYSALCIYVALGAASGFGSFSTPALAEGGSSYAVVTLRAYGLEMISLLSVVSVFLLISTVAENGVAAVGLCMGMTVICSICMPILHFFSSTKWIEYTFFEQWQIAGQITNSFPLTGWTIGGSIAVLAAWIVICIASGIAIFQWRDVKS